jgi:hypothetical protein
MRATNANTQTRAPKESVERAPQTFSSADEDDEEQDSSSKRTKEDTEVIYVECTPPDNTPNDGGHAADQGSQKYPEGLFRDFSRAAPDNRPAAAAHGATQHEESGTQQTGDTPEDHPMDTTHVPRAAAGDAGPSHGRPSPATSLLAHEELFVSIL